MKKREEGQFFDGLLLGGLITGVVIACCIVFLLFHDANEVGEGSYIPRRQEVLITIPEQKKIIQNTDEIGKSVIQNERSYIIEASFTKKEEDLTYRSLIAPDKSVHASIWSKEGEQLLYKANNDIFVASGAQKIEILDILSAESLLISTEEEQSYQYNLKTGMVIPQ